MASCADTQSGKRFETVNPATGEVITSVPSGDADDVDRAVRSARWAFRAGVWSRLEPRARMDVLYRFATLIDGDGLELGLLDTLDVGKPIMDMVAGDVPAASLTFHYFTETIFTGSTDVSKLMMVYSGELCSVKTALDVSMPMRLYWVTDGSGLG
jgi:acyl-CoA reductase-like NAD-dependent aldehyde dehydrogenase